MSPPFEGGLVAEFGEPWAHVREFINDGIHEVHLQIMLGARDRICYCFVRRVLEKQLRKKNTISRLTPVL